MADPVIVEPQVAPAPAAPASAPAPSPTPEPASPGAPIAAQPDPGSAVTPAPAGSPPAAEAGADSKPADPVAEPTLLETFEAEQAKKAEPEAKPAVEAKPVETEAKPAGDLPVIDYFAAETGLKLPDTIKLDDGQRTELVTALDTYRANPSAATAQPLIDMHAKAVGEVATQLRQQQWDVFNDTRAKWVDQVKSDPEMGGPGYETTMRDMARARDMFVPESRRGAFAEMLRVTGAGDNPELIRMMAAIGRMHRPPAPPPADPKPAPENGRNPAKGKGIYNQTTFRQ